MAAEPESKTRQPDPVSAAPAEKTVTTQELFGAEREIYIEHDGERYRLRITRRNKLILQK